MSTERILSLSSLAPKEGTVGQQLSQVSPGTNRRQDYYLRSLHPSQKINRMGHDPVQVSDLVADSKSMSQAVPDDKVDKPLSWEFQWCSMKLSVGQFPVWCCCISLREPRHSKTNQDLAFVSTVNGPSK